ncbi:MAG: Rrf2 family transcriptional regulator [Candidatus Omnitrophota bacterium]|jgi:Rrf2 family protein
MKITYRGDYALKAVLDLAINYDKIVTIHDLASHAQIPIKFLEQVLLDLKRGRFVESRRGKVGGYLLAKHPSQIKIGDLIRYIDGPLEPIACTEKDYSGCADIYKCTFRNIFKQVAQATSDIVDNITFEDLAKQVVTTNKVFTYQI